MKLHQHVDKTGNIFGKAHPVSAKHEKESTQRAHDRTIEKEKQS